MVQYISQLQYILANGEHRIDRTGVGTLSCFGSVHMEFNLQDGFPLVTTKKVMFKSVVRELLWFLSGSTNVHDLQAMGCHIWDANYEAHRMQIELEAAHFGCLPEEPDGDLGPIYGHQWRRWESTVRNGSSFGSISIDQIENLISMIRNNPSSRRLIVSAWNVADIDKMALPPCHTMFQCYVRNGRYLDLCLYQRSGDMFLGVPFNIASYALLDMMLAQQAGLVPGRFIHNIGDAHIYENHIEQVREQVSRNIYQLPRVVLDNQPTINDYKEEHIHLIDYVSHPSIKADMAV